jgi:hypothetical protein
MNSEEDRAAYLAQLTPKQLAAIQIAERILGTSFDLFKSQGFLQWKKNKSK